MSKCCICGKDCKSYTVNLSEVLVKDPSKTFVCHNCIDYYLDTNSLDAVIQKSIGKKGSKWEGYAFFEKAIILDGPSNKLLPYLYRCKHSWKDFSFTSRIIYDTQRFEEVEDILHTSLSNEVSSKQLNFLHALLNKRAISKEVVYKKLGITSLKQLSKKQASKIIDNLLKGKEVI